MLSTMFAILAQDQPAGNPLGALPLLVVFGGIFYFLLIRPQQKRAKAQRALVQSAEVGDEIVTTSGIFGTILDIDEDDDVLTVEIAPGTQIRMVRAGVGRRISEEDTYEEYDEDEDDDVDADDDHDGEQDGPGDQQGPITQL